jgi:hypothetical protein
MPTPPPAISDSNPQTAVFPGAIAHDIDLMVATNRALSTIINPIDSIQSQIDVVDGSKFSPPCLIQIDTEIIRVGSKNGNSLFYCTRGFSNTAPASHGQSAEVKGYVLAYHFNQIAAEIKALEEGLGAHFGNVVMRSDTDSGIDLIQTVGQQIGGKWTGLHLMHNGVTAGTYGGFNTDILISVDNTGRVSSISNSYGNINYPIIYKAAIVQGTNAVIGFSFGNDNAPAADIVSEPSGLLYGVCKFTSGNDYWVQDHFYMPDDWDRDGYIPPIGLNPPHSPGSNGKLSCVVYWRWNPTTAGDNTGTVCWGVRVGGLRSLTDFDSGHDLNQGNGPDVTWGGWSWITETVPTGDLKTAKSKILMGSPPSSILPGDELFFQFARGSSGTTNTFNPATPGDTGVGEAELISIKFNINRNFSAVQE